MKDCKKCEKIKEILAQPADRMSNITLADYDLIRQAILEVIYEPEKKECECDEPNPSHTPLGDYCVLCKLPIRPAGTPDLGSAGTPDLGSAGNLPTEKKGFCECEKPYPTNLHPGFCFKCNRKRKPIRPAKKEKLPEEIPNDGKILGTVAINQITRYIRHMEGR